LFFPYVSLFLSITEEAQFAVITTAAAYAMCVEKYGGRFHATMLHSKERVKIFYLIISLFSVSDPGNYQDRIAVGMYEIVEVIDNSSTASGTVLKGFSQ
jgi:hypothetical protein